LNLEKTAYSTCPATEEPAGVRLQVVQGLWKPFLDHMNLIITGQDSKGVSLEYVLENNLKLMGAMNSAVSMMQKMSEKKVQRLIVLQSVCLVGGVILMVLSLVQIQGIVLQLLSASSAAKELGKGDFSNAASTSAASAELCKDIAEVSQSVSHMSANSGKINLDSEKLLQLAEKLNKMVAHFKIA
jgi:nitrate/nitrite-specific signal transduction histidine kinase